MFQVNLGSKILYYPSNDEFAIYDTELVEDVGQAGEFTFKVPPTNLLYNEITNGALITILKDKKEFWRGEIRDISIDFAKIATVYAVEDIAWLADEYIPPAKITNQTYKQRLDAVIATYNANRPTDRRFTSGNVYNGSATCNWQTEYEWSILDCIRNCICRDDLYVKLRRVYEAGVLKRYVDVVRLDEYGKRTQQPIEYGYNLLDYVKEQDYGNLTNVLTPYGDELENQEIYTDYSKRLQGTTISNQASINVYGRHAKAVVFDGVTTAAALNNLSASYLSRYCQPQLTMEVKAVDLSQVENVEDIAIGDQVHVIAKPFAVDQYLYLTQIKRDLQNVDKNTITLSGYVTRKTLTNQVNSTASAIKEVPTEQDILNSAKKNALSMLLDETQGGYVVYEYDSNNANIEAINICDQKTIAASKKRWRWSQNGLGYMERNSTSAAWPTGSNIKLALTSDGQIVANRITSGELTASVIKAGILKDLANTFSLNLVTGDLVMNGGTFKGALSAATGTFAGSLSAAGGTFNGKLESNGSGGSKVTINNGAISSNSLITADGLNASNVVANTVSGVSFETQGVSGATGQISWATSMGGYSINVKNGLVVGISHT